MNYDRAAIEAMRDTRERLGGCSLMTLRENKLVLDWLELEAEVERLREIIEKIEKYNLLVWHNACGWAVLRTGTPFEYRADTLAEAIRKYEGAL